MKTQSFLLHILIYTCKNWIMRFSILLFKYFMWITCSSWWITNPTFDRCKNQLKFTFRMKELDKSKSVLWIYIHKKLMKSKLWLSRGKYFQCVFEKIKIANFRQVCTSLAIYFKLYASQCPIDVIEKEKMSWIFCEKVVDILIYLMVCTKYDVAPTMYKMRRYMSTHKKLHD